MLRVLIKPPATLLQLNRGEKPNSGSRKDLSCLLRALWFRGRCGKFCLLHFAVWATRCQCIIYTELLMKLLLLIFSIYSCIRDSAELIQPSLTRKCVIGTFIHMSKKMKFCHNVWDGNVLLQVSIRLARWSRNPNLTWLSLTSNLYI